jgi:hypothetical protein
MFVMDFPKISEFPDGASGNPISIGFPQAPPLDAPIGFPQAPPLDAPMVEHALFWAAAGFRVIPCCWPNAQGECGCGRGEPHTGRDIGKAPLITAWPTRATRNARLIRRWWAKWPTANVGTVVNEASGYFVCDCDKRSPEAEQWRERLAGLTRVHQTSEPHKWHAFLKRPAGVSIAKKSTTTLGLNTECGQVLLPPSRHRNGSRYSIVSALPVAEPPAGLVEFLQSLPLESRAKVARKPRDKFKLDSGGLKIKTTDPLAEKALRALNEAKTAPPCGSPRRRSKVVIRKEVEQHAKRAR